MNTHSHVRTEDKWINTEETQRMPMRPAYHMHAGMHSPHTLVRAPALTTFDSQPEQGVILYSQCQVKQGT